MQRILLLECGPYGRQSRGSRLAQELVGRLRERHPGAQLVERDLRVSHCRLCARPMPTRW